MSSTIGCISDENVENLPPSTLPCPTTCNVSPKQTNSSKVKRNDYLKHGRRKKWWYFNRGLQPISEVAEIKDDLTECYPVDTTDSINNRNEFLNIKNDTLNITSNDSPTDHAVTNIQQGKEGYSACLKVIEKFQEVVMDSAVRVIQVAFKRFRERRRFLRIKKAVMVIQRNLRKWLQVKHPCLRPAEFERQSSDGSKSDEYRESEERNDDDFTDKDDHSEDVVEGSETAELELNCNACETQEYILEEDNSQTFFSESGNQAQTPPNDDEMIESAERHVNNSNPTDPDTCNKPDNVDEGSEPSEFNELNSSAKEMQEVEESVKENISQKSLCTLESEEDQICVLVCQNDSRLTQKEDDANDVILVERDVLTVSEDVGEFTESAEHEHLSSMDETQIMKECVQEDSLQMCLTSLESQEKENQLNNEESVEENTSETSSLHYLESDRNQIPMYQNADASNAETSTEFSFENDNNTDNENNLNDGKMLQEWTVQDTDNDIDLDCSMQECADEADDTADMNSVKNISMQECADETDETADMNSVNNISMQECADETDETADMNSVKNKSMQECADETDDTADMNSVKNISVQECADETDETADMNSEQER